MNHTAVGTIVGTELGPLDVVITEKEVDGEAKLLFAFRDADKRMARVYFSEEEILKVFNDAIEVAMCLRLSNSKLDKDIVDHTE